jgi:hypothetical protein
LFLHENLCINIECHDVHQKIHVIIFNILKIVC